MSTLVDPRLAEVLRRGGPTALLGQFDIPTAASTYVWSRSGTLNYNGQQWQGTAMLGKISGVSATTALAISQVTFVLAGVPNDQPITTLVRNGRGRIWMAAIKGRRVVSSPELLVDAQLDYATLKPGDDNSVSLNVIGNVGFWKIARAINLVWSHEGQQVDHAGDTGLSLLPSLANKVSNWRHG